MRSFDEITYIFDKCHKLLSRNEISCQAVFSKMSLDPIPDELKDLKKVAKIFISKRIILKKIAIMHGKGEFTKIKGSIFNIPTEAANICNILSRPADSNELIVVKWKRDIHCGGYVYFEPVCPNAMYQALNYLKTHSKFCEDISFSECFSSEEMTNFSGADKLQNLAESIPKKILQMKQKMVQLRIHSKCTELDQMKQPKFQSFHL